MDFKLFYIVLAVLISLVSCQCDPGYVKCCLSEFLTFISPQGINLPYEGLFEVCTKRDHTIECLENFSTQCGHVMNEDGHQSLDRTKKFIAQICSKRSAFKQGVKIYEECLQKSSDLLQECYIRSTTTLINITDVESKWISECSEYRVLKDCAVDSVRRVCGHTSPQLIIDAVVNINGAVLEVACRELATKSASSVFENKTSPVELPCTESGSSRESANNVILSLSLQLIFTLLLKYL